MYTCYIPRIKILASFCSWAGWFESYLVKNLQRHIFAWCGSFNVDLSFVWGKQNKQKRTWLSKLSVLLVNRKEDCAERYCCLSAALQVLQIKFLLEKTNVILCKMNRTKKRSHDAVQFSSGKKQNLQGWDLFNNSHTWYIHAIFHNNGVTVKYLHF